MAGPPSPSRERGLALLALTAAALSILVQAARGRPPIELSTSGLRYEAEAADDTAGAAATPRSSSPTSAGSSWSSPNASTDSHTSPNL